MRIPTAELTQASLRDVLGSRAARAAVVASVVPDKNTTISAVLNCPICWVGFKNRLGVTIDYPRPETLGADRLANVAACVALHGAPAIVMDFGTATTFDVISAKKIYLGGVIAPGLKAMTEYLSARTALLPQIELKEPTRTVGKSTVEAMLAGAMHGYRGMVREIIGQISRETFPRSSPRLIATGGDAPMIAKKFPIFHTIDPRLTLEGLRIIGMLNPFDQNSSC